MGGGVTVARILFLISIFLLSFSESALANIPPSPQSLLALISILPIMILLTLLGGGYSILKRHNHVLIQSGKKPWELRRLQWTYEIELDSARQDRGFKIHLTPTRFPLFPYNYFTSRPSYLVDHAGNIRMVYVHRKTQCPMDAPVVMRLGNDEIQQILSKMHQ